MKTALTLTLIYLFSFGSGEYEGMKVKNPHALSIDMNGFIYIADTDNNRILKVDQEGELLRSVGGFGWGKEQFDTPLDICASSLLDVFVADYNNQRVERYDKDLNYISSLVPGDSWDANLIFGFPASVTISKHGELIILDSENSRLLKINSFGEPELSFGDFGSGEGKLDHPVQVELSQTDEVYVTDKSAGRIIVYDYFGNYIRQFGEQILESPTGIHIDDKNRIWVIDSDQNAVMTFDSNGTLIGRIDKIKSGDECFKNPKDVVISENKVFILDGTMIHSFEILQIK